MRWFASLLLAGAAAGSAVAEPIRFARSPDVSPDGKLVAFSYLGDVWLVSAEGGTARLLTMHERHDTSPVFSPDGARIAFASNRHGNYDVFVVPVDGGRPTRLTFDSADEHPTGWSPDGTQVLFTSSRGVEFPSRAETFAVPASGGASRKLPIHEAREAAWAPGGKALAYVRGPGAWYRKGYRGSSNDEIWLCDPDGANSRPVSNYAGQDNCPMWSPDGKYLYSVSDRFGVANIVRQEIARDFSGPVGEPTPVTRHADRVRKARLSADGSTFVYELGFDLWVHSLRTGASRPVAIEARADDKSNPDKLTTFTQGATEYALSADEKQFAIVVQGEIFLLPRNGGKAKRLTDHPAFDHGVAWAPDSKKILFLSDRNGYEDIYALEADDPEHPDFVAAHKYKVTQLTKTPESETGLGFAPDGKRIAFLRAGKLVTAKPDCSDEKVIVGDGGVFDYEWSPDSQWLCYARSDGDFASELYVVPAGGATADNPVRNVTRFATFNGGVTWSRTNNRLAFVSRRKREVTSAFVLSLNKPSASGAPAPKEFDWDGVHLRVKQPSPMAVQSCAIATDGGKIAFRSGTGTDDDLWVAGSDGGQVTRITTGGLKPQQIQWSRYFGSQLFFRDGNGQIRTANVGANATPGAQTAVVPFVAKMLVRRDDQFAEIFDQSWRALSENFYDPKFHGVDWKAVRERYRPIVKHCASKEDLFHLVYLMLGELNASHLGITGNLGASEQTTAELGVLFDPRHSGPGLKIAEILKGGPIDQRGAKLKAGDVVLAIEGATLDGKADPSQLLADKAGETIALTVTSNPDDPRGKRRVEVVASARPALQQLHYERWLERNAQTVDRLSKGRLAYIHIPSMDDAGVDRFLRAFYSDAQGKDGIVLDVRFNGGGFTHETILNYLLGREHTKFSQRDGGQGFSLNSGDRKWAKPLTLLINNRSYSDAEIFPNAFREYGLGKLVGEATGGYVIGTRNISLIDGSQFRTPRIGVTTTKGVNMEKQGVMPDVSVIPHPDQLSRGEDPQLERAVQVLLDDVAAWRRSRPASPPAPQAPSGRPSADAPPARP